MTVLEQLLTAARSHPDWGALIEQQREKKHTLRRLRVGSQGTQPLQGWCFYKELECPVK